MLNNKSTHASETMRDIHFPTHFLLSGERGVYRPLGEEDGGGGIEEKSSKGTTCLEAKAQRKPETGDTWF